MAKAPADTLTAPQRALLAEAVEHPKGNLRTYGVRAKTVEVLRRRGYVEQVRNLDEAEVAAARQQMADGLELAAKRLGEGQWKAALRALSVVERHELAIARRVYRLTPDGREAVAALKEG